MLNYFILPLITSFTLMSGLVAATKNSKVDVLLNYAKGSGKKVFSSQWPYSFTPEDELFDDNYIPVQDSESDDIERRFKRMVHIPHLHDSQMNPLIERIKNFMINTPVLVPFIENKIANIVYAPISIQNISIYGSYLYNDKNPEDVDLLVIVNSPVPITTHLEFSATTILGNKGLGLPDISFQVIDYGTYIRAKQILNTPADYLTVGERLAQQQYTTGSNWFFTIYGFDLKYKEPDTLKEHMKLNYLNGAFNALHAAGERLYKAPKIMHLESSEPQRLRKVISRILITDFLVSTLDKSYKTPVKTFEYLYNLVEKLNKYDSYGIFLATQKVETLYLTKLRQLITLADKYNKLGQLRLSKY